MSTISHSSELVRTIRLDDARVAEILDQLDNAPPSKETTHRSAERYEYRVQACVIHMRQPGATALTPCLVATRNISSTGLAFLHGGFVHANTTCLAQLISTQGTWRNVKGQVIRCRHIAGNIHEVGVSFDMEIEPSEFSSNVVRLRVLLVEAEPTSARLATFHLRQLHATVEHTDKGQTAIEMVRKKPYDVLLLDVLTPDSDGFATARELRGKGYSGMIVALTGLTERDDRQKCLEAGCDRYLPKPLARDDLVALINVLKEEPLYSDFHGDVAMSELIDAFVTELPSTIDRLKKALAEGDTGGLEALLRALKAEGGGHGFAPIAQAAAKVEAALTDKSSPDVVERDLDELISLCRLARPATLKPKTA